MSREVLLVGKRVGGDSLGREKGKEELSATGSRTPGRERCKYVWKNLQNGMECNRLPPRKIQQFKTHYDLALPLLQTHISLFTPSTVSYLQLVNTLSHFSAIALAIFSATFSLLIPFCISGFTFNINKHPFVPLQHPIHTFPTLIFSALNLCSSSSDYFQLPWNSIQ